MLGAFCFFGFNFSAEYFTYAKCIHYSRARIRTAAATITPTELSKVAVEWQKQKQSIASRHESSLQSQKERFSPFFVAAAVVVILSRRLTACLEGMRGGEKSEKALNRMKNFSFKQWMALKAKAFSSIHKSIHAKLIFMYNLAA